MDYEISVSELKTLRDSGTGHALLDVRELWEIQTAQIGGSKHIPDGRDSGPI